jgi:nucleoid DNA-binding protein
MGNRLNTKAVVAELATRMGCYKKDVTELMGHFTDLIAETLAKDGVIDFRPLGVFRRSRKGAVKFRPAKKLSRRVKQGG